MVRVMMDDADRPILPDFSLPPIEIKSALTIIKSRLVTETPPDASGTDLACDLSIFHSDVIRESWKRVMVGIGGVSLAGIGSFARRDMGPNSDVDIQIVHGSLSRRELENVREHTRQLVKFLWDIGVEVGHSLRSVDDCVHLVQSDPDIRTALLESRYVCGDPACFQSLLSALWRDMEATRDEYLINRMGVLRQRHEKHGGTERVMEPHLKEGVGGLRDLHTALWLWRIRHPANTVPVETPDVLFVISEMRDHHFIDRAQAEACTAAFDFIIKVRAMVHRLHNRRVDHLDYATQARAAAAFGYEDTPSAKGVELFMRQLYGHLTAVRRTTSLIFGKLALKDVEPGNRRPVGDGFCLLEDGPSVVMEFDGRFDEAARRKPELLMKAFRYAADHGAEFGENLEVAFCESLDVVNDSFCHSKIVAEEFMDLWRREGSIGRTLTTMHRLGFLERYLTEFGFIVAHCQYNVYHRYTTDEHLLVAVRKLEEIFFKDFPGDSVLAHLKTVYEELTLFEKYQLYWAVFLHDIGKGRTEDHCDAGVRISKALFDRVGFSESREAVAFLIANHLKLEQMAFRRNLKDPETIDECAKLIHDRRLLRQLLLLTYADMAAANAAVWTEWKGMLLWELFQKTDGVLRFWQTNEGFPSTAFDWESMESKEITLEETVKVLFNDRSNYTEVLVMTSDRPYRLSQICGAMAVNDVSIFEANVQTRSDGIIADHFRVVRFPGHEPLTDVHKDRLERDLKGVLDGKMDLAGDLQKLQSRWKRIRGPATSDTEILFDANSRFSIIDIFTKDRIGLLYLITKTLSDLRVGIHAAKIGTRLDGVADCFYVLEKDGTKVTTSGRQEEIRAGLLAALNPASSRG